ncbi:HD domain-containing protein [Streptomyces mayteni]
MTAVPTAAPTETDDFGDLPIPRTAPARAAARFARSIEHPALFHHSVRSYLYGRFLGERQGLRAGHDYDDELLFLGCVLHDAGLSREGNGEGTFDVDGADLAAGFLAEQGVADDRVAVVWDAVALHLHYDVAVRKRPEIALVTLGAGYDIGPDPQHPLPPGYVDRVHAVLPRLHAAAVLHDAIVGQALAKPHKAPPFTMPGELVRQRTGGTWPGWRDLVGWGDYDGYLPDAESPRG